MMETTRAISQLLAWHMLVVSKRHCIFKVTNLHVIILYLYRVFGTLSLKMTTAQVVESSVTVNNNSPIQDYVHPDDQTQPTFETTPGFKPFTITKISLRIKDKCESKTEQLELYH